MTKRLKAMRRENPMNWMRHKSRGRAGLPVTPFRTDDWPGVTSGVR